MSWRPSGGLKTNAMIPAHCGSNEMEVNLMKPAALVCVRSLVKAVQLIDRPFTIDRNVNSLSKRHVWYELKTVIRLCLYNPV